MNVTGLPPELAGLLARLQRRGLPVTPLAIGRLQHLLAVPGTLDDAAGLPALLTALLCKDEQHRTLFQREYRAWAADFEGTGGAPATTMAGSGSGPDDRATTGMDGLLRATPPTRQPPPPWHRRLRTLCWRRRFPLAAGTALLALAGLAGWWFAIPRPPVEPPPWNQVTTGPSAQSPTGSLCPQDLPTEPVPEVWAWVPVADDRPWGALGGGLVLLILLGTAARRLWTAPRRWLPSLPPAPGEDRAPGRGLPPRPVRGDLLLAPAARRELVWSIDRYVSEDPDRALDPEATVAASARAGGEPCLVQRRCTFPRQVWLWCDKKTARPATLDRLVLEIRRALEQANLPVRCARFHGLPGRLLWEDSREPFAPGCQEAAGAAALVAVLTDGVGLVQAWDNPGERPRLAPMLRELRSWPRLLLVDLGAGELTRLAPEWRLAVRGPEGLAAWLAASCNGGSSGVSPGSAPSPRPPPDPAQLDLWAAACLLGPERPDQAEAERLRCALDLRLSPFDDGHLAARLEQCALDQRLATALVARLARAQTRAADGRPTGDGYLTRALDVWEARLADGLARLPEDDVAARARLRIAQAQLWLWRDPAGAAEAMAGIGGERNRALIRQALAGCEPEPERGPTWHWQHLPVAVRWRLRTLGLGGRARDQYRLRRGARHHLALALLTGIAGGGLGWGLYRLTWPHQGGGGPFGAPAFTERVLTIPAPGRTWLGSPWRLTALAALGPLDTPHTWAWQSVPNPDRPDGPAGHAAVYSGGTRAFPIRACTPGWPRRSLAVIAGDRADEDARKLAIRLLDRGAADRVLIAPDWPARLEALTQGVRVPADQDQGQPRTGDQLLVFLPSAGGAAADVTPAGLAGRFDALAEVRGDFSTLARTLNFPGTRSVESAWSGASTRTLAGRPQVSGGPQVRIDPLGVTWVEVCGGTFLMGSPESEDLNLDRYAQGWVDAFGGTLEEMRNQMRNWMTREHPIHPVLVQDFEIARTELTQGQSRAAGEEAAGEAARPLANLPWQEAADTCKLLEQEQPPKPGWQVGLPTEAQWEFAARAGTATSWSFGNDQGQLGEFAWFGEKSRTEAHPVGEKSPNGLCLADMHGNLYEWVGDCLDENVYGSRGPVTIEPFVDQSNCERRVVRGGSFGSPPFFLRSADRADVWPGDRGAFLGLRCVRSRARQP